MPMLSILRITIYPDTQEQIIIGSPKQRKESSQDSGLENSTPEVSPPGAQTQTHWRTQSPSSGSSSPEKITVEQSSKFEQMTQPKFISAKNTFAPMPPNDADVKSFSDLNIREASPKSDIIPSFIERHANANFICKKDHHETALCKAIVAQGDLEYANGTFKAVPNNKNGKFSSVKIEIEATRENHAKVAAIKTIPTKETIRTSGHFKPMCELIDENNRRQRQSSSSVESSISPASSSRSSDFGGDNGSIDRMSYTSSNAGNYTNGRDYKVVALDAKPQPGKLTEFVPEVERTKKNDGFLISSFGSDNSSPPPDAAVVRNWELSDEEQQTMKIYGNNNNERKNSFDRQSIEEVKHEPAYVDRKWIRSQGYPKPFDANSKNLVNADSKFRILPKDENRNRPTITKVSRHEMPPYGLTDTRRIYNDSKHPSGGSYNKSDIFSEEKKLNDKSQTLLTVSGKLRCGHCACELGRGSAMIIEALGLFYHINCFRCHVCDTPLGSGNQTTDVRVREGKLHCEKCYSNEDIGVKLSEI